MSLRNRFRNDDGGATAVEFAIICFPLLLVSLGVVEFGRALNVRNDLAFAADFAVRSVLTDATVSNPDLDSTIRASFTGNSPELLQIDFGTATEAGVSFRTLAIAYPFDFVVPGVSENGMTLSVSRRIPLN